MKLETYVCDECGRQKAETNHWWTLIPPAHLVEKRVEKMYFVLSSWNVAAADIAGVKHLCSESCAIKALSKWMSGMDCTIVQPAPAEERQYNKAQPVCPGETCQVVGPDEHVHYWDEVRKEVV